MAYICQVLLVILQILFQPVGGSADNEAAKEIQRKPRRRIAAKTMHALAGQAARSADIANESQSGKENTCYENGGLQYLRNSYLINQVIEDNCDVFLREDTLKSFSRSIADAVDIEEYSY